MMHDSERGTSRFWLRSKLAEKEKRTALEYDQDEEKVEGAREDIEIFSSR